MTNLDLNLLPPLKRKKVKDLINFLLAKNLLGIVAFICLVLSIFLLWSWLALVDEFSKLSQSATLVDREYGLHNQEIRNLNKIIRNINFSARAYAAASPLLLNAAQNLPADIKLTALHIDRGTQTITLSGTALTRLSLLVYQEVLKSVPWLEKIETPASQLFQKANINFEIRAKIKNLPALPAAPAAPLKPSARGEES